MSGRPRQAFRPIQIESNAATLESTTSRVALVGLILNLEASGPLHEARARLQRQLPADGCPAEHSASVPESPLAVAVSPTSGTMPQAGAKCYPVTVATDPRIGAQNTSSLRGGSSQPKASIAAESVS